MPIRSNLISRSREAAEVPRNVVNHAARGDNRPQLTAAGLRAYEEMSMEDLRERADNDLMTQQRELDAPAATAELTVFLKRHPEFINSGKDGVANAEKLLGVLLDPVKVAARMKNGHTYLRCEHFEEALELQRGELALREDELHEQRCADIEARVSQTPASEKELYKIPLDDLRQLATGGGK